MRVLVVEDEEDIAIAVRESLLEHGHAPRVVPSVVVALDRLATERPEAIVLNLYYYFPGMSGLDFLRLGQVRAAGIPIVAVSGFPTEGQARECLRLGAIDFMRKPVAADLLREIIAYLEVRVRGQRLDGEGRPIDRRRSPRVHVTAPVRVTESGGAEWPGTCVDLNTFGMKIRSDEAITPGMVTRLNVTLPEGGAALDLLAVLVRKDSDAYAYRFVDLAGSDFTRLNGFVGRVATADLGEHPITTAEAPEPDVRRRTRVPATILIVEDQQELRDLVREFLEGQGYTLFTAADGREALKIAERHAGGIHLVLTDIVMPGMSGWELVEQLTAADPTIRILYMSGYADEKTAFAHGVHGALLRKPFTMDTLAEKVREALDRSPTS
jgi:DNA-binding response OmpR family regulator